MKLKSRGYCGNQIYDMINEISKVTKNGDTIHLSYGDYRRYVHYLKELNEIQNISDDFQITLDGNPSNVLTIKGCITLDSFDSPYETK